MDIREAIRDEYGDVGTLMTSSFAEYRSTYGEREWFDDYLERIGDAQSIAKHALVLVATEDGKVVGTVCVELERTYRGRVRDESEPGHIRLLSVLPSHRRRGIGEALVREALYRIRSSGRIAASLNVSVVTGAIGLYERIGFQRTSELDESDDPPFLGYVMTL